MKTTKSQWRAITILAVGFSLMAASSLTTATAAEDPKPKPAQTQTVAVVGATITQSQMSPAEIEDLKTYAKQNGVSFDQAKKNAAGQDAFAEMVAILEAKYASSLVSEEWVGSGTSQAKVVFHESVPKGAMDLLRKSPVKVQVIKSTAPSAQDRDRATQTAYTAAISVPGATESIAYSDPATGNVTIEVPRNVSTGAVEIAARRALERAPGNGPAVAQVTRSAKEDLGAVEYRGGMLYNSAGGQCTGGFVVKAGSAYGISTARHCGSATSYDGGKFKANRYLATATGDMRWEKATSGSPSRNFQYKKGSFRAVTSVVNPTVGQTICKFGYSTNNTCSTVYKTGICSSGYCGLYSVTSYISNNGDSGGPWYYGNIARGIHHGRGVVNGKTRSLFTRIGVLSYLDASVYRG